MSLYAEKKFRVQSFDEIKHKLKELGAKPLPQSVTHHFYAHQNSHDVTKLVVYEDHSEIHILKEVNGTFELADRIPMSSKSTGLEWLHSQGRTELTEVTMNSVEYDYENGRVGLYMINDSLLSVILDFPPEDHDRMTELFGLTKAEVIRQPYNKYLESNSELNRS